MERSRDFFWNRVRWELICSRLPASGELVDVGAGPGFLGDFLRARRPGIDYRFIEPIEGLERGLEERFGAAANRRESADFGAASSVTLMDVLEHQEDGHRFMAELAAKMAPGATLLLTVPAMPWLWSDWDSMLGHYRRYTKRMLRETVAPLPLEIVEQSYLFPELIPLGLVRRLRMRGGSGEDGADAEFPQLSRPLNETLYRLGSGTTALRRLWPAGTSLFATLRRT
jgi:hypothetical protein